MIQKTDKAETTTEENLIEQLNKMTAALITARLAVRKNKENLSSAIDALAIAKKRHMQQLMSLKLHCQRTINEVRNKVIAKEINSILSLKYEVNKRNMTKQQNIIIVLFLIICLFIVYFIVY